MKNKNNAYKEHTKVRPNVVRIIFGIIVGFLCPLVAILLLMLGNSIAGFYFFTNPIDNGVSMFWKVIIFILFLIPASLFLFYAYGWLHKVFYLFCGAAMWYARIPGKIVGILGYVMPPWVLIVWGANKKWLYFLCVGMPSILIGGLFILNHYGIVPFDWTFTLLEADVSIQTYSLPIAIAFLLNGFLALCTKRCPACGCMMTEIEHELTGIQNQKYAEDCYGDNVKIGKFYICKNCDYIKKGIGFEVQTDGYVN